MMTTSLGVPALLLLATLTSTAPAAEEGTFGATASTPEQERTAGLDPDRTEWSFLPVLAGDTDTGFLFGGLLVLAKFERGHSPYLWRADGQLAMSVKRLDDGVGFPKHADQIRLDLPGLLEGRLRLSLEAEYFRLSNAGYYGLGNASPSKPAGADAAPSINPSRRNQYILSQPKLSVLGRFHTLPALDLFAGLTLRYSMTDVYPGSALADDRARVYGTQNHLLALLSFGVLLDTRDRETGPSRGMFHELSLRASPGDFVHGAFGGFTLHARFYQAVFGEYLVVAARALADVLVGSPPYYELANVGAYNTIALLGGSWGVRGVPMGRYHGKVKVAASVELRSMLAELTVLGQHFRAGLAAFMDAGRVWAELERHPELDGTSLGLKVGTGGGLRLQWGETVMIRADCAYSPSAAEISPDFPAGVYVEVGESF